MNATTLRSALMWLAPTLVLGAPLVTSSGSQDPGEPTLADAEAATLGVEFLEIVTPDRDATCALLESLHGVTFSDPVAEFGNSRTAPLAGGGLLSVREPMHGAETPVVRPYLRVDDIDAAVQTAADAGGEIAMASTPTVDDARFAIYFHGGNQYGLWKK